MQISLKPKALLISIIKAAKGMCEWITSFGYARSLWAN